MEHEIKVPVIGKNDREQVVTITIGHDSIIAFSLGDTFLFDCQWFGEDGFECVMYAVAELFKFQRKVYESGEPIAHVT